MRLTGALASVLAAAGMLALPAESQAGVRVAIGVQVGSPYYYRSYRDTDAYRLGYDRGYQEGYNHGARDGHRDRDYNFWHDKRYRNADAGYKGWMGPRFEYQNGFRAGYEAGYRRSYARFDDDRYRRYRDDDWRYRREW